MCEPLHRRMPISHFWSTMIRAARRRPILVASAAAACAVALVITGAAAGATVALGFGRLAAPHPAPSASAPVVDTSGFPTGVGIFTDRCGRTQTKADDPILMPGMSGQSMHHDFFGNRSVDASTTTTQLVGGSTSCSTTADASAYWTPVLYQDGTALAPDRALLYWRAPRATASSTTTIPAGLTMIAGNEKATTPQGVGIVKWTCSEQTTRATASPQDCPQGQQLRLAITFPNCWDGHTLDGKEQTNVIYPPRPAAACPASHPVQIPQIVFHADYPTSSASGLAVSIGPTQTGSVTTEHADFMNGWNRDVFAADVSACIVTDVRCGAVTGPQATPQGGRTNAIGAKAHARRRGSGARTPSPRPTASS